MRGFIRYALAGGGAAALTMTAAFLLERNEFGTPPAWASLRITLFALLGGVVAGTTLWIRSILDARSVLAHYSFCVVALTLGAFPGLLDDAFRRGEPMVLWYAPAFGLVVGLSLAAGVHYLACSR